MKRALEGTWSRSDIVFCAVFAFIACYIVVFGFASGTLLESDMKVYFNNAQNLLSAGFYWPIGYPLFLSPFLKVFGPDPSVVVWINFFLHLAGGFLLGKMVRSSFGIVPGLLAMAMYLLNREQIFVMNLVLAENLMNPLIIFVCYLALKYARGDSRTWLMAMVCGFAMLVKANFAWVATPVVAAAFVSRGFGRNNWKRFARFLSVAVLVPGLYGVFNSLEHGRFVPMSSNGPVNLYIGNNPKADGVSSGAFVPLEALHGPKVEKQYVKKAFEFRRTQKKRVRFLTTRRLDFWWGRSSRASELYSELVRSKNLSLTRFVSTKSFPTVALLGMVLMSVFFLGRLESPVDRAGRRRCRAVFLAGLATLAFVGLYFLYSVKGWYGLYLGLALVSVGPVLVALIWPPKQRELWVWLAMSPGFHLFTGLFTFLFFVKVRFRSTMNIYYSLTAAFVVYLVWLMLQSRLTKTKK